MGGLSAAYRKLASALPRLIELKHRLDELNSSAYKLGQLEVDPPAKDRYKEEGLQNGVYYYGPLLFVYADYPLKVTVDIRGREMRLMFSHYYNERKLKVRFEYYSDGKKMHVYAAHLMYLGYLNRVNNGALSQILTNAGAEGLAAAVDFASHYLADVAVRPRFKIEEKPRGRLTVYKASPEAEAYKYVLNAVNPAVIYLEFDRSVKAYMKGISSDEIRFNAYAYKGKSEALYVRLGDLKFLKYGDGSRAEQYADYHFMALDALYNGALSEALLKAAEEVVKHAERLLEEAKKLAPLVQMALR